MSWQEPSDFERDTLSNAAQRFPEILPLARLLSLALRIEPLLLRNARARFLERDATELESLLWFSPLIGARSSREVVLHGGVARLLAEELRRDDAPQFERAWACTREHTAHWRAEDRLEQDLRHRALIGDTGTVESGLKDMLRRIARTEDEDGRVKLARWVQRALPIVAAAPARPEEAKMLAQFAGQVLGTGTISKESGPPGPLPVWLANRLPPPYKPARLGAELRYDAEARRQVLHFAEVPVNDPAIDFPTALPAELHVACDGDPGLRYRVAVGTRIPLPARTRRVLLTAIDGHRYELAGEPIAEAEAPESEPPPQVFLTHVAADSGQARHIADWLAAAGIPVQLLEEGEIDALEASPNLPGIPTARLLRLWTRAAQRGWSAREAQNLPAGHAAMLLRAEAVDIPPPGSGAAGVLDVLGWERLDTARKNELLGALRSWLDRGVEPPAATEGMSPELQSLLAELDDPTTEPPRRLAIGDRLAELGDPRAGVGVREYELEEAGEPDAATAEQQALLRELADPDTKPPRRLAIGDLLAEQGDPRPGVGLDERGLPDLAWVEIPAGEFIYQRTEKRSLPTFYMARYPITNVQYQTFVDAGGYQDERWWKDIERQEPQPSRWPQANRPRTTVSWYEAVAFCRWLSAQLGYEVRLPTEQEWERAASGVDGRAYPWGDKYLPGCANVGETFKNVGPWNLMETTAVGVYAQGKSPEGMFDLAGNVWEWCANKYDKPGQTGVDTSGDDRVLRGGSWYRNADLARASNRGMHPPDERNDHDGFRVVSSAPIK